jgi:hypothetical protein
VFLRRPPRSGHGRDAHRDVTAYAVRINRISGRRVAEAGPRPISPPHHTFYGAEAIRIPPLNCLGQSYAEFGGKQAPWDGQVFAGNFIPPSGADPTTHDLCFLGSAPTTGEAWSGAFSYPPRLTRGCIQAFTLALLALLAPHGPFWLPCQGHGRIGCFMILHFYRRRFDSRGQRPVEGKGHVSHLSPRCHAPEEEGRGMLDQAVVVTGPLRTTRGVLSRGYRFRTITR